MIKYLCVFLLLSNQVLGASLLDKGAPAPFKGLLFSIEEAQNVKNQLVELDYTKELNKSLNRSVDLYKLQIKTQEEIFDIYSKQNEKLENALKHEMSNSQLEKIGYFFLGIITASIVVYAAK